MNDSKSADFAHVLWVAIVAALILLNAFLAIIIFVSNIDYVRLPPNQSVEEQTQKYEATAQQNGESDIGSFDAKPQSSSEAQEEYGKDQQSPSQIILDIRDLYAQEGMWLAAYALVAITLLQFIVGVIALFYIYQTFRVQKGELEEAKRANIPYLSFVDMHYRWGGRADTQEKIIQIFVKIKNIGKSPALNISQISGARLYGSIFTDNITTTPSLNITAVQSFTDAAGLPSLSPDDSFYRHIKFAVVDSDTGESISDAFKKLPRKARVNFAFFGDISFGEIGVKRHCTIAGVIGDGMTVEYSGIGLVGSNDKADGQIIENRPPT